MKNWRQFRQQQQQQQQQQEDLCVENMLLWYCS